VLARSGKEALAQRFLAWFIFIGPRVAEFTHFIFPILKPAIQPELAGSISQAVSNGPCVASELLTWRITSRPPASS
jgi:hypothetical protein